MNRVLVCSFAFLLGVTSLFAQLPTGTILGVIKDSSGAVVPGAEVTARQTDTNQSRTAATGEDGAYRFDQLAVGAYEITVKANGFSTDVQSGVTLAVGQEMVSNFTLQVGAVSQTVSVSAEASTLVTTTNASLSSLVTPDVIADMPLNGRNYNDLTLLQMGVTKSPNSGISTIGFSGTQFSSNGAPQRSNTYLLDGGLLTSASDNNGSSAMGTTLGVDGIQEYRIITNNFDAEYGMTMGSQMTVASKGGTNNFHGGAFGYLRNSVFDARNYFDLPAYSKALSPNQNKRNPDFRRGQFGGSIGGPIQKDKTFFFAVYEGLRAYLASTQLSTTLGTVANPTGCQGAVGTTILLANCPQLGAASAMISDTYMQPFLTLWPAPNLAGTATGANNYGWTFNQITPEDYGQIRIDHTFSGTDNIFGRYTIDESSLPFLGAFYSNQAVETARNQFFTLAENHIFTASVVNSARASFSREPLVLTNQILDPRLNLPQYVLVPGNNLGMGSLGPGGVSAIGDGQLSPREEFLNLYTFADDVNWNRGKHSFKFGGIVNHYAEKFLTHGYDRGIIAFSTVAQFMAGQVSTFSVTEPTVACSGANCNNQFTGLAVGDDITKYINFLTMGFYAQDSFKATSRVTLNIGMRYEPTTDNDEIKGKAGNLRNPLTDQAFTVGNPIFTNPSLRNWSPRFGFAWDVFGDGKTAIRGGYDLLYDLSTLGSAYMLYAGYGNPFAQNFSTSSYNTIAGQLQSPPVTSAPLQVPVVLPPIGSFTPSYRGPTYHQNQPHLMSWNLGIERQLPGQMALTVAFAGSKGLNLYSDEEGNDVVPSGIPTIDSAGNRICSAVAFSGGVAPNDADQYDNAGATSCYAYPLVASGAQHATLQCSLPVGLGTAPVPGNPTTPCYTRANSFLPSMVFVQSQGTSLYNALDVNLTKRVTHGLQFNTSYTWSKLMDNHQGDTAQDGQIIAEEPIHRSSMWAPAVFDLQQNFHLSAIYHFPNFTERSGFMGVLANGWMTNGILSLQSGYPFSTYLSSDRENIGYEPSYTNVPDTPDVVAGRTPYNITHGTSPGCNGVTAGTALGTPQRWFDPCAFSLQPEGFIGTEGRDFLRGPSLKNVDFSIVKDTNVSKLGEAGKIEFRAEIFDVFNHPNFALPSGVSLAGGGLCGANAANPNQGIEGCSFVTGTPGAVTPLSTAGSITSTITNPGALPAGQRQIQFGLKLMF
jgi:hypothetical protein